MSTAVSIIGFLIMLIVAPAVAYSGEGQSTPIVVFGAALFLAGAIMSIGDQITKAVLRERR